MYSFLCKNCGHTFEELVPMSRRAEVLCPKCGGPAERSWEGSGAFSVGVSSDQCACETACASGCGCDGACRCGQR